MVRNSDEFALGNGSLSWKDFSARLKVLWERDGNIAESLKVIDEHPEHKENTGRTGRRQILRVLGELRLISSDVIIPERSGSPVYTPLRDRVMYCVYSTPVFNSNGYSTRSRGVASGLKAAGADVVVVARSGYPWDWKIDTSMPKRTRLVSKLDDIDYVHLPNGAMNVLSPSAHVEQAADAFVQEALNQRPAYLQAASNYRTALPSLIAARRLGIPFIYEVRGLWEITGASNQPGFEQTDRFYAMRDYESRVAREADHVFAITEQVKEELIARGVDSSRISLAPNAVDPEKFYPQAPPAGLATQLGLEPNLPVIGFAGSMVMYEGLHTLLRASLILHERGIEHQIALAGSGNTEQSLKGFARENKMSWVKFLGRIPQDQVPQLLSLSNIIVTPRDSTVVTELVSALKPLEAFAAGRPVVLSDVAPNLDLAGVDQKRAKIFTAGNSEQMAGILEGLLEFPLERIKIAKEARQWIESERNWLKVGRNMFGALKSISTDITPDMHARSSLSDLKVGYVGNSRLTGLIDQHLSVLRLDVDEFHPKELEDLDFVLLDFSKTSDTAGVVWDGAKLSIESSLKLLLERCRVSGLPCIGILTEGLSGATLEPDLLTLLDTLLVGNFDGVLELLEDPHSANVRVGLIPPLLSETADHTQSQLGNLSMVVDNSGLSYCSKHTLIEMLDPDFEGETRAEISWQDQSEIEDEITPAAIYVRKTAQESTVRELISVYGLRAPILFEKKDAVSGWFGDKLEDDVQLIEFIALINQWSTAPEGHLEYLTRQREALVATHSVESWLLLMSRSLGFPVGQSSIEQLQECVVENEEDRSQVRREAFAALLKEHANDLVQPLLRSLSKS